MKLTGLAMTSVGLMLLAFSAAAQDATHGAQTYKLCAGCHGFKGEGNELVNAPAIAGQEAWYLERQIRNFRTGIRGHSGDDNLGQLMSRMTLALHKDDSIADVVAYISSLPTPVPATTISGDIDKGRAAYGVCATCHGARAEGNVALNSPALKLMDDWYQVAQLQKFKAGARGRQPGDIYGMQMAPMAATLADEAAMHDIVAYISSLGDAD